MKIATITITANDNEFIHKICNYKILTSSLIITKLVLNCWLKGSLNMY